MNNQTWCALIPSDREALRDHALSFISLSGIDTDCAGPLATHISEHVGVIWDQSLEVATADYQNTGLSVGAVFERSIQRLVHSYSLSSKKVKKPKRMNSILKLTAVLMAALTVLLTISFLTGGNSWRKSETTERTKMVVAAKSET